MTMVTDALGDNNEGNSELNRTNMGITRTKSEVDWFVVCLINCNSWNDSRERQRLIEKGHGGRGGERKTGGEKVRKGAVQTRSSRGTPHGQRRL